MQSLIRRRQGVALAGALAALAAAHPATAHGIAGNRVFPATLATDDPAVSDELSLPTISRLDTGDGRELDVSGEYSKRITRNLGVSFGESWTRVRSDDGVVSGFQNLETTLKYQLVTDAAHEAIVSLGLSAEWGGTGAEGVGAERVTTLAPQLYFGKGAGDLPDALAWARPFAITGLIGYALPVRAHDGDEETERTLSYGVALEYSLPYLSAHVRDLGLPGWVNRLTPVVEAAFETPFVHGRAGPTTGTVNPGLIWSGRRVQLGVEAIVPINAESGHGVGVAAQLHLFLDDIFPTSIGKPLFGAGR